MALLFRTLCILIGAAFLFAVANLVVSGVPSGGSRTELAAGTPADRPVAATDAPGVIAQLLAGVLGGASDASATPVTAPSGARIAAAPAPATPANGALPEASAAAMADVWRGWMDANGVAAGAMAVILPDGTEYGTGLNRTADVARPIMSLSRAVTGLCLDLILAEADLPWSTTLADIAPQMSAAGVTPRPWNQDLTLAGFATHTSGLAPDLTQANMAADTHGALGLHRRWAAAALQDDAITGTPGEVFYSNTNYAVLGVVIEALSGQSYAQACTDRIIEPTGIRSAVIEGRYGSLSSYGGWEMSAIDHARLAAFWFAPDRRRPETSRPTAGGYSLGYRDDDGVISHGGRFCRSGSAGGGVGALFLAGPDGTIFSANWDGCLSPDARDDLGRAIRDLM